MGHSFSGTRHPASLVAEDRAALRLAFVGNREDVKTVEIAGGGVVFLSEGAGKFYATGFAGKAVRPAFHHYFRTLEHRDDYIARWSAGLVAREKARADRKAALKADKHGLVVGTILFSSWGYEQTNCNYYLLTAVLGEKMVEIREIAAEQVDDGESAMTGRVTPVPTQIIDPPLRKRATSNGIRLTSFSWASVWDGRPRRISWYA